jgi:putative endonuclease
VVRQAHHERTCKGLASRYNRRVHFVYIVRCADGTLYTGYARDPGAREHVHNSGRGARYTAGRRPVRLVYRESFASIGDALRRERELKGLSRAKKEALIISRPWRRPPHAPCARPLA